MERLVWGKMFIKRQIVKIATVTARMTARRSTCQYSDPGHTVSSMMRRCRRYRWMQMDVYSYISNEPCQCDGFRLSWERRSREHPTRTLCCGVEIESRVEERFDSDLSCEMLSGSAVDASKYRANTTRGFMLELVGDS